MVITRKTLEMNKEKFNRCKKILDSANFRLTKQRQAVLGVLFNTDSPVTQQEIAERLGKESPDKVTIYRVLQTFIDSGLVHKAYINERTWHFELAHNCSEHQCHPHFTCTKCGHTHCMHDVKIPMVQSQNGFMIDHQQVQLTGLCPKCNISGNRD